MRKSAILIAVSMVLSCSGVSAEDDIQDPALLPVKVNVNPLPQYSVKNLDFAMMCGGIAHTQGKRLWAFWTAGGDSGKAFTVLMHSDDNGESWSDVDVVSDAHEPDRECKTMGGCLWTDPDGRLWAFYGQSMSYFDGRSGTWYVRCDDPDADKPVWSDPVRIWHGSATNTPIVLNNGKWLLPVTLADGGGKFPELDGFRGADVLMSPDKGKTWEYYGGVRFPHPDYNEHSIIELPDGRVWMTARTSEGIWQSFSSDEGRTWTVPSKYLNHNKTRHLIMRFSSGRLLLVKHGNPDENPGKRVRMTAFVSDDGGKTWRGGLELDERKNAAYPYGCQAEDGTIYIVYDRNRDNYGEILMARISEESIAEGSPRPEDGLKMIVTKVGRKQQK